MSIAALIAWTTSIWRLATSVGGACGVDIGSVDMLRLRIDGQIGSTPRAIAVIGIPSTVAGLACTKTLGEA